MQERRTRTTWNSCANCTKRKQRRYFVHELTSEVNSRMKCVAKIMATPGTRTAVADLCDCEVNVQGRTGMLTLNTNNAIEKEERTRTWVRQVAQAMEEHLMEREQRRRAEDARRIRGIVHENDRNKRLSHAQNEMVNLMHHDEQELLSIWGRMALV